MFERLFRYEWHTCSSTNFHCQRFSIEFQIHCVWLVIFGNELVQSSNIVQIKLQIIRSSCTVLIERPRPHVWGYFPLPRPLLLVGVVCLGCFLGCLQAVWICPCLPQLWHWLLEWTVATPVTSINYRCQMVDVPGRLYWYGYTLGSFNSTTKGKACLHQQLLLHSFASQSPHKSITEYSHRPKGSQIRSEMTFVAPLRSRLRIHSAPAAVS